MNIFQYIEQERDDAFFEPGETQPPLPTGSPIGSERVEAYAQRVAKGQPIILFAAIARKSTETPADPDLKHGTKGDSHERNIGKATRD